MLNGLMAGDYEGILVALADLYVLRDLSDLPQTMMRIAEALIPCVFCTYNELRADTQSVIIAYRPEEWRERMQPYVADAALHLDEHPV
jgi:hypothetical protein